MARFFGRPLGILEASGRPAMGQRFLVAERLYESAGRQEEDYERER